MAVKEKQGQEEEEEEELADPMAATERQAVKGKVGPAFVASKSNPVIQQQEPAGDASAANQDEIHISDDEDL